MKLKQPLPRLRVRSWLFLTLMSLFLTSIQTFALIMVGRGNQPVHDPGWPEGALKVANMESRVGWWEGPPFGGGEWQFLYRGDAETLNKTIETFATIRAPAAEVFVHDGPHEVVFLKDEKDPKANTRVDWTFTIWVAANWHHLFNNPKSYFLSDHPNFRRPVDPPRLDIYLGDGDQLVWEKVKMPQNIKVIDQRASAAGVRSIGGAVIRASVFDIRTGKPIRAARLKIATRRDQNRYESIAQGVSDESGFIHVEKIPAGTYQIAVSADGYAARAVEHANLQVTSFKQLDVYLDLQSALSGMIVDTDGKPIKGVKVRPMNPMGIDGRGYVLADQPETETDDQGRFELKGLPAGFVQLSAHHSSYYHNSFGKLYNLSMPGRETEARRSITLRMVGTGKIHIQVLDRAGKAIGRFEDGEVHVHVEAEGGRAIGKWGGSARVNDEGAFEFTGVPPGKYRVASRPSPGSGDRKYTEEQVINVVPGQTIDVKMVYR